MGPKNFFDALKREWLGSVDREDSGAVDPRGNSKWWACIIDNEGVGSRQRTCSGSPPGASVRSVNFNSLAYLARRSARKLCVSPRIRVFGIILINDSAPGAGMNNKMTPAASNSYCTDIK